MSLQMPALLAPLRAVWVSPPTKKQNKFMLRIKLSVNQAGLVHGGSVCLGDVIV